MSELDQLATYSVAEAADVLKVTEPWYAKRLRDGEFPGHKIGRQWRLTQDDIRQALELTAKPAITPQPDPSGLTRTSRRRLTRRRAS